MRNLKRFLTTACTLLCLSVLFSCSGPQSSPTNVAKKSIECLQEKDYEGYIELLYTAKASAEAEDQEKEAQGKALLQGKLSAGLESVQGIKSFEMLGETLSEDGESAEVSVKIVYGNGEEKETEIKTRKDEDGKWWLKDVW